MAAVCDDTSDCAICLSEFTRPCRTVCSHTFCRECIVRALQTTGGYGNCPVCRQFVGLVSVVDEAVGEALVPSHPRSALHGSVWVQQTVGSASYHFPDEAAYISYESKECDQWPALDNGTRPPRRKYFVNAKLDEETRTFVGTIDWSPTSWQGAVRWEYMMRFSPDLSTIWSGQVRVFREDGVLSRTDEFGHALKYINAELLEVLTPRVQRAVVPVPFQDVRARRPGESFLRFLIRYAENSL
uniref:RING-type domain-containing protein n=1 Tax=Coccolithus braarudii TaxID=221442 RepID=A0A7S0Q294_9EUKA|mmetsp:Transcript_34612/g.73913  ORF Transcript_34612/g.73913 Transcript_34612/m.73913 type:complete len:242 (+) Transcript_34612:43-768(+)